MPFIYALPVPKPEGTTCVREGISQAQTPINTWTHSSSATLTQGWVRMGTDCNLYHSIPLDTQTQC